MTLLYYDPLFLQHDTGEHPENAGRLLLIVQHFDSNSLPLVQRRSSWQPASLSQLCYVHNRGYVQAIERFAAAGGGRIESDTTLSLRSYEVATMAAGAVCDAVVQVVGGQDTTAFCLVRPPGHHAMPDHAMGFCLFNHVAIGARVATEELGIERVLIVDFDVHHGNGTQAMFWEAADVGYFSMHRAPFYPGTGSADERGAGPGLGTTRNLPITMGTPRAEQCQRFAKELTQFAAAIEPQLVIVSAGFDSHRDDPIGSLGLCSEDFAELTRCLLEVAAEHAQGKIVSVLEGGYHPAALAECVKIHVNELAGEAG